MTSRNYELEFIQAFEDLGWEVLDCSDSPELPDDLEANTVLYQFKPKLAIPSKGKKGRTSTFALDFAIPRLKVYMEFDGFFAIRGGKKTGEGGHRSWSGFHRDRRKDRALTVNGWRGFRYGPGDTGKSVVDTAVCAREFLEMAGKVEKGDI